MGKNSQCLLDEGMAVSEIAIEMLRMEKYRLKARPFLNILLQEVVCNFRADSLPLRASPGSHCWTCSVSCTLCCCRAVFDLVNSAANRLSRVL